jgi:hypothetical protein
MMSCNVHGMKGFAFVALTTTAAILVIEPAIEWIIKQVSASTAAKLGIV